MEFFKIRRTIPFMRHALIFNVISAVTFLAAVFFLAYRGLNFSVEFTGGTLIEVGYQRSADVERIRKTLDGAGFKAEVQNFGSSREVLIRMHLEKNQSSADLSRKVIEILKQEDSAAELRRVEFVGPQVGSELANLGSVALLVTAVLIVLYLWMRFEWRFGLSAIVANLHDVVIILGCFAFFQWEFSLPVLAAVLAVLGYSVNESVVVFDRVRKLQEDAQGDHRAGDRQRDHRSDLAHHHHAPLHADDGHHDAPLRRPGAALFRTRADHRHLLRHLLLGARREPPGHVARRQARPVREAAQAQRRAR